MGEWKETYLGEYADVLNGFAFKSEDFSTKGVPVIKIKNVASGKIKMDDVQFYPHELTDKLNKFLILKGSILIAMTGSHATQPSSMVGRVSRYDLEYSSLLNQRVGKIYSKDLMKLNETFLYYFLVQNDVTLDLAINAGGSANQANIAPGQIKSIPISLPALEEQKSIASILSSLDDKIGLLQRQNKTLEALAETLFRQWFVEEAEEGWETGKLGDYILFTKGKKPSDAVEDHLDGLAPQILIETFDTGKTLFSNPENMIIASEKDILMVMDGASSGRVEIGFTGIVGSTIGLYKPLAEFNYPLFIYLLLRFYKDHIQENTTGSAIPHADKALILNLDIQYPNIERVIEFENMAEIWFEKKKANRNQIRTLTRLRDTLLPKLLSGEVRVEN